MVFYTHAQNIGILKSFNIIFFFLILIYVEQCITILAIFIHVNKQDKFMRKYFTHKKSVFLKMPEIHSIDNVPGGQISEVSGCISEPVHLATLDFFLLL